ncbi:HAMP domain-containing sensor histidine kinase [Spirosoma aerolatum]|uniref:HAMP domain-containing sensor histidine kinase n=1 Tax=Spirosoma aerolatum TaxID=1211326 RepID=UPI0009ABD785|nr:HAMP domain-containing sensor histidine kinase [Spirosoma aerolatum]
MTIRNRLTIRFTGLVSSILLLAFVSIYAFCWYFISSDFYRRLDRKANTIGDMLIRHRLNTDLIRQLTRIRKDQLPNQKIIAFDQRDSIILSTNEAITLPLPQAILSDIRQVREKAFRQDKYYVVGTRFMTASGQFVVIASAENMYGDEFLRRLLWSLTGLFCLIVAITAFSGWFFADDALRPVQAMDRTLNAIFPKNRDERLPLHHDNDEISRLSQTINQLLDRVNESFRLQRMFVANVSHELKNPLTLISSQLEVSLLNERGPEAYRQTIRSVLQDVTELASLTHELLRLSQLNQNDAVSLLTDRVRVDEIVWDVRAQVKTINPLYAVTVQLGALPEEPDQLSVQGNKTLLETALKNLTENACKFSDDGRAEVNVDFQDAAVTIRIQNQGKPIPTADLPYIFEPFYRSSKTAEVRGYGIGLSLVERIVRLHRGHVQVSSSAGQPTVFSIILPRQ